jgi:hypothetical protein
LRRKTRKTQGNLGKPCESFERISSGSQRDSRVFKNERFEIGITRKLEEN